MSELDKFLVDLGFHKTSSKIKKLKGGPYSPRGLKYRLLTYEHPNKVPKVKVSVVGNVFTIESDCGKKQRTAWKPLVTVKEFRRHFML
ncbi:hypothetical protein KAW11_01130 [Candidatus Bathyarchaeota archaeon]|nr:hypothetical protein [Candidatus Bathyarchaeota archaeon]